ncbi:putative 60S ribosomal protein L6 [Planoprotostelium fungivorum]|uniref:Large ribosomal subunit protein eL6 n=1 Tax=Planoprotostelium fungivorum TaxID=1890364 RepID=A0A2P6N460_9EUKA|nr:putative 60S ribosomal protein L6 [Planoprotostelium fungivorum]
MTVLRGSLACRSIFHPDAEEKDIMPSKQTATEKKTVRKTPGTYPTEKVQKAFRPHKKQNAQKLRASITPGTVLIVLSGRFAGKRVVFLKQSSNGLLIVTGPYELNGVPVRRIAQHLVIATSTKVDVSAVDVSKFDDAYFAKPSAPKQKKSEQGFFAEDASAQQSKKPAEARLADQKSVDGAVLASVKKTEGLASYLAHSFSLRGVSRPVHLLKF